MRSWLFGVILALGAIPAHASFWGNFKTPLCQSLLAISAQQSPHRDEIFSNMGDLSKWRNQVWPDGVQGNSLNVWASAAGKDRAALASAQRLRGIEQFYHSREAAPAGEARKVYFASFRGKAEIEHFLEMYHWLQSGADAEAIRISQKNYFVGVGWLSILLASQHPSFWGVAWGCLGAGFCASTVTNHWQLTTHKMESSANAIRKDLAKPQKDFWLHWDTSNDLLKKDLHLSTQAPPSLTKPTEDGDELSVIHTDSATAIAERERIELGPFWPFTDSPLRDHDQLRWVAIDLIYRHDTEGAPVLWLVGRTQLTRPPAPARNPLKSRVPYLTPLRAR